MSNLNDRCTRVCGSVNFRDATDDVVKSLCLTRFIDTCESYKAVSTYYLIPHYETDTFHIHYILLLKQQQTLLRVVNVLSEGIGVESIAVNVQRLNNLGKHLRYMIHQDETSKKEGKQEYSIDDLVSNESREIYEGYINSGDEELDSYTLLNIVLDCDDEVQIMHRLGLKYYHKFRYEIKMILENQYKYRQIRNAERVFGDLDTDTSSTR